MPLQDRPGIIAILSFKIEGGGGKYLFSCCCFMFLFLFLRPWIIQQWKTIITLLFAWRRCNLTPILQFWNQGRKKQGKRLSLFNSKTACVQPFFYFRTLYALQRSRSTPRTWCLWSCCHGEAYLSASISVPCATYRSIGLPELRHCKRHFRTDPDV